MIYTKLEHETDDQYINRVCKDKETLGFTWETIASICNNELNLNYSESWYRRRWNGARAVLEEIQSISSSNDVSFAKEINEKIESLQQERYKIQAAKREYAQMMRENARDELIIEQIIETINKLPELKTPSSLLDLPINENNKSYCLAFGDEHYGKEFELKGLYGEIINAYSPEKFEQRMWQLLSHCVNYIKKENVAVLNVFSMGDFTEGILRVGQLMTLKYGVIEGSVKYGDFLCNWLNELSKFVYVNFQMVYGNHSELRMLGQPKGTFEKENVGIVVKSMIQTRLANNPNFNFIENPSGLIFTELCGFNLLGIHGEVKNMEQAIKDFSKIYKTDIDILIGGHLHHFASKNISVNSDVINVPSIMGSDDYSLSLFKTANPGALLFVVEENYGVVQQNNFRLD